MSSAQRESKRESAKAALDCDGIAVDIAIARTDLDNCLLFPEGFLKIPVIKKKIKENKIKRNSRKSYSLEQNS